ncbi:TonB-dependent receptor [Altererythrobacter soli]|uniref:TonB-dependent receptor n=1 Tax=Croceibacterium soli TaxID=1739690 RepID=A0A6I4UYS4_9SPHN|nr:TonB-dependent receptor [Croceibacterium soli]MXP42045.1 TonB-dependent receptor [Croceibacterium soli]
MNKGFRAALICSSAFLPVLSPSAFAQEVQSDADGADAGLQGVAAEERSPADSFGGDIVVTARRTSELISDVPISISAFSQEKMDVRSVKTFEDIANITPGVAISGGNRISIRGVIPGGNAGTTGIYIDDTPIQVYSASFATDALPLLFDLERVEVLRGPQGTLFGSGSMGGTIRYITPQPDLTGHSTYARAEVSALQSGGVSYEAGVATGGPIVADRLAFRVSGIFRRDAGWIDRVDRRTGEVIDEDHDWQRTYVLRGALTWAPIDGLEITPAILHQNRFQHHSGSYADTGPDVAWEGFSDPNRGIYRNGARIETPGRDRLTLYSLAVEYDLGPVSLFSNSSYYDRKNRNVTDASMFEAALFGLVTSTGPAVPGVADYDSHGVAANTQKTLTQEVRLQSNTDGRLSWVVGAFYQKNKQFNQELVMAPSLDQLIGNTFGMTVVEFFGQPLLPGDVGIDISLWHEPSQIAGFGEISFDLTDRLSLAAGVRIAESKYTYRNYSNGPYNNGLNEQSGSTKESSVTPKFSANYDVNDDIMVYATAAKGFRAGGANQPIPLDQCSGELNDLGLTGQPASFESDSVWSYELGTKSRIARGLNVAASAYHIDWTNIQRGVALPLCGFGFTTNLGSARIRGFDLQADARLTDNLTMGVAVGHVNARFQETIPLATGENLVTEGDRVPVSPWTVSLSGDYVVPIGSNEAYLHAEYNYAADYRGPLVSENPLNSSFDPDNFPQPSIQRASIRSGVRFDNLDVSLFVNNLWSSRQLVARENQQLGSPAYFQTFLRPRTIGLTVSYRR